MVAPSMFEKRLTIVREIEEDGKTFPKVTIEGKDRILEIHLDHKIVNQDLDHKIILLDRPETTKNETLTILVNLRILQVPPFQSRIGLSQAMTTGETTNGEKNAVVVEKEKRRRKTTKKTVAGMMAIGGKEIFETRFFYNEALGLPYRHRHFYP